MASQGVSEEIATHHPSVVVDNFILNALTIDANDGSAVFQVFGLFVLLCEFIIISALKKSPVLVGRGLSVFRFECLLSFSDLLPHWDLRWLSIEGSSMK